MLNKLAVLMLLGLFLIISTSQSRADFYSGGFGSFANYLKNLNTNMTPNADSMYFIGSSTNRFVSISTVSLVATNVSLPTVTSTHALCKKTDGAIGQCNGSVGAGGTCTCQ